MIFETLPPQQIIAWSLTILELILASYVLVLNVRFRSNRAVAALLFVFAMNNLGLGMLFGAQTVAEAQLATILVAMTSPAIPPLLLIVTVVLFNPRRMSREPTPTSPRTPPSTKPSTRCAIPRPGRCLNAGMSSSSPVSRVSMVWGPRKSTGKCFSSFT